MPIKNFLRIISAVTLVTLFMISAFTGGVEGTSRSTTGSPITEWVPPAAVTDTFNLTDYGAVGDGVTDDGPALQDALDAIADAGGGTLLVPAGRYSINTPVSKDFTGLAQSVIIQGVESSTPVPPPTAGGSVLTRGLDLMSEFYPRTGAQLVAVKISGLQNFLIKDIAFVGTPDVNTDAYISLSIDHVDDAVVRHCEFYGLSSLTAGGGIVIATWSRLAIEQSVFLGCTTNSGYYTSVVQNLYWKGITVSNAVFADYGQRPELFGKLGLAAPFSWISINNAVAPDHNLPRREAVISSVFLDEGALQGIASRPNGYLRPSAPIDLLYVTGLFVNVSNLRTSGHYLEDLRGVLIENSHYGWSHNADSAITLFRVNNAILDRVECVASADRIRADAQTGTLTVINSIYDELISQAQVTNVIEAPDDDPVDHVRQKFMEMVGRAPDAAAHFYWSNELLQCGNDPQCDADKRAALDNYLSTNPSPEFAITGRVVDETGAGIPAVAVALSGSQNVVTETDVEGRYHFSDLPTSGVYSVTPTLRHHSFNPTIPEIVTPAGDQVLQSTAIRNRHNIQGFVADQAGNALDGVSVTLSGSRSASAITEADGFFSFDDLPAGGNYVVHVLRTSYAFNPATQTFNLLDADQQLDISGTFVTYSIGGVIVSGNNQGLAGVTLTLSGSENRTTTTDATGNFSFAGVPSEGNYTVTPSLIGQTFTPAQSTYTALGSNEYRVFSASFTTHSIRGRVTIDEAALAGAVVTLSGYRSSVVTTNSNGDYLFSSLPRGADYAVTVTKPGYTFDQASEAFDNLDADETADFSVVPGILEVLSESIVAAEEAGAVQITVTRGGDTSRDATIRYSADDGTAQQGNDTNTLVGQLSFAPGEISKDITIFITDDAFDENDEQLTVTLSNPEHAVLGLHASAVLTITDNDTSAATTNPIDEARFFVRQQYRDFLNRDPDAAGLDFWSSQIVACGNNQACLTSVRQHVSAAFFLSIEFQETGFLVYRLYRSAYGQVPRRVEEFLFDTRLIGEDVVVGAPGWDSKLEANKVRCITQLVGRPEFVQRYPLTLTPAQFVEALNVNTGSSLSAGEVTAAVAEFGGAQNTSNVAARQRALRKVAENRTFVQRETNSAFVLMQYFGYLQRNPDDAPDFNLNGFNFWLGKLNQFGGSYVEAELVRAFIESFEYRQRFGR